MLNPDQVQSNGHCSDHPQLPSHSEKRRKIGKDPNSHGPTLEVPLVDIDLVVFGRFEIKAWYPSPYVLNQLEYLQSISNQNQINHPSTQDHKPHPKSHLNPHHHQKPRAQTKNKKKKRLPIQHIIDDHQQPASPSNSTSPPCEPISAEQERSAPYQSKGNNQRASQLNRNQSPDSLSSLGSSSVNSHRPSNLRPKRVLSPTYPYPSPQSHPPSQNSDAQTGACQLLPSSSNTIAPQSSNSSLPLRLYVCDGCLRYLLSPDAYLQHKLRCCVKHPPGRKVYQKDNLIIREVDGSNDKLYCQCLCLFGKLFIDHKYIFFDVSGFKFYVLTEEEKVSKKEEILGFFSKEKISYDGYNLACIVTLPPYQKKGYGTLLIEFSYELDRFEDEKDANNLPINPFLGTPERPLSELGAKGYLNYWTAVLIRFFRTLFTPPPPSISNPLSQTSTQGGSSPMIVETTLEKISRSTRLRPDDAAFALISSGLTKLRKKSDRQSSSSPPNDANRKDDEDQGENDELIIITRELVEKVADRIKVKRAILDPRHVLLTGPDCQLTCSTYSSSSDSELGPH